MSERSGLPLKCRERVRFPSHGLIVRPNVTRGTINFVKGIVDGEELGNAVAHAAASSADGHAFVQTDMRAHLNPTRMRPLAKLAPPFGATPAAPMSGVWSARIRAGRCRTRSSLRVLQRADELRRLRDHRLLGLPPPGARPSPRRVASGGTDSLQRVQSLKAASNAGAVFAGSTVRGAIRHQNFQRGH